MYKAKHVLATFLECNDEQERLNYYAKLDKYINNYPESCFEYIDLIKFCEATLLFVQSKEAQMDSDGLVVIFAFIQRLTLHLNSHFEKSSFHVFFIA